MIKCLKCGKIFRRITVRHLKQCSNITMKEYLKQFPDAEVVSEETKKKISKSKQTNKQVAWNKGLTKETDERVARAAIKMKEADSRPEVKAKHSGDNNVMKNPVVIEKHLNTMRSDKFRRDQSARMKLAYKTPEVKERHATAMQEVFSRPDYWEHYYIAMDKLQHNEEYKISHKNAMNNPEVKAKLSDAANKWWSDPCNKQKFIEILNDPAVKEHKSISTKKQWENKDIRKRRSEAISKYWSIDSNRLSHSGINSKLYGIAPPIGSGVGNGSYYFKQDGSRIWLRSTYEVRMAKALDYLSIPWEYESKSFNLSTIGIYHPDFWLPDRDMWLEVKGYMRPEAQLKLVVFHEMYRNIDLRILYDKDISKLENDITNTTDINICEYGIHIANYISNIYNGTT